MLESAIERKLRQNVEKKHGRAIKLDGYCGIPDRMVLLPGGWIYFIETKTETGETRKKQYYWRDKLRALGFEHRFVRGRAELDVFLYEIGAGPAADGEEDETPRAKKREEGKHHGE